jgi:hypothetical protein
MTLRKFGRQPRRSLAYGSLISDPREEIAGATVSTARAAAQRLQPNEEGARQPLSRFSMAILRSPPSDEGSFPQ